jgi:pimeloyl-ACP methyl ester carboxylesterase
MAGNQAWVAARLLLVAAALVLLTGCVSMLGGIIVAAPNVKKPLQLEQAAARPIPETLLGVDEHFRVEVGPPSASLSICVLNPDLEEVASPRGTILVLHGMGARSAWMHGTARMFAGEGYRAVLVDLRGHGASTGRTLSYGLQEAEDLSYVIDALEHRDLLAGRLGVYGISYGAASAIHLAARDPRVSAVVAVAPFSDMRSEVSHYIRTVGLPGVGTFMAEEKIQLAVDEAGQLGGFSPDLADAALAIERTHAPVLLVHGRADVIIPNGHSRRLHEAAPQHSELVLLRGYGHIGVWIDPLGRVGQEACTWFERHL